MGWFTRLIGGQETTPEVVASTDTETTETPTEGLTTSKALLDYILATSAMSPLQVTAVLRCVDLLSTSLAMLPMRVLDRRTKAQVDHPLYRVLQFEPNDTQTAFEFKRLMERRRITEGNAYALIIRSGPRILGMQPIKQSRVQVKQNDDWSITYKVRRPDGRFTEIGPDEMFHLRDLSDDEVCGDSRFKLAKRAIDTSRKAEEAQNAIFENGIHAGGFLTAEGELSDKAFARLKADMKEKRGTLKAGEWMILEEGVKAARGFMTSQESQTPEARAHQIEEIARVFGVPRPLLMMDDTSWGSGIEQLATLFVRFGLAPSMVCWEQAAQRSLLTSAEKTKYLVDIDERLLLRGSLKDQAEYYAKASGAGGHSPWLHPDEIRRDTGEPPRSDEQKQEMERTNAPTFAATA